MAHSDNINVYFDENKKGNCYIPAHAFDVFSVGTQMTHSENINVSTEAMPSFATGAMASVAAGALASVATGAMPSVATEALASVATEAMASVATEALASVATEAMLLRFLSKVHN